MSSGAALFVSLGYRFVELGNILVICSFDSTYVPIILIGSWQMSQSDKYYPFGLARPIWSVSFTRSLGSTVMST